MALRKLWQEQGKQLHLQAIEAPDGTTHSEPHEAALLLRDHWAEVFGTTNDLHDNNIFNRLRPHAHPVPQHLRIRWEQSLLDMEQLLGHLRPSAPGPDGIPYGAWQATAATTAPLLMNAYQAFLQGIQPPMDYNCSLMIFLPKGEDPPHSTITARTPPTPDH